MEENNRSAVADNADSSSPGEPDTAVTEISSVVAALTEQRDQLARQQDDLKDRHLRLQAEFENFRRRAERERMDFAAYAGMEMASALLPTVDDLERAIKTVTES